MCKAEAICISLSRVEDRMAVNKWASDVHFLDNLRSSRDSGALKPKGSTDPTRDAKINNAPANQQP